MAEPTEQPNNIESGKVASALPQVESPPLSPGDEGKAPTMSADVAPEIKLAAPATPPIDNVAPKAKPQFRMPPLRIPELKFPHVKIAKPKFSMSRRLRRRAALAAIVLLAAGFGAAIGGVAAHRASPVVVAKPDTTALEETYALQKQIARLSKELTALKASSESAIRESKGQLAKLTERVDHPPDVTGSIGKQAVVAPSPIIDKPELAPIPQPRPAIAQTPAILPDWALLEARNGRALVANRGEVYEVAVGNPLPGLGGVEAIRRDGTKWVVVTSKGIIMPAQSSAAVPPRGGYVPYYQRY